MKKSETGGSVVGHAVDFRDKRAERLRAEHPVHLDAKAAEVALAVAGVKVGPDTKIIVRVTEPQSRTGVDQGCTRQVGPDTFIVKVRVGSKPAYEDRHHYQINNTLLHELRHVAQMQADPHHGVKYEILCLKHGYQDNPYEVEARYHGRLADHTGTKDTGPAGRAVGRDAWAVRLS